MRGLGFRGLGFRALGCRVPGKLPQSQAEGVAAMPASWPPSANLKPPEISVSAALGEWRGFGVGLFAERLLAQSMAQVA